MDYNKDQIEALLNKYWEGETTLQEEVILQSYFNNGTVATQFKAYQPLFQYFTEEKKDVLIDQDFDFAIQEIPTTSKIRSIRRKSWFYLAKIAASVLLIFSIAFWLMPDFQSKSSSPCGELSPSECKEAMQALEETKTVLFFVSNKLNYGAKKAAENLDRLNQIEQ